MVSKYDVLRRFLERTNGESLEMTFAEVAKQVGGELPESATLYREWWSNNESHTHAKNGWLAAGWRTAKVDMEAKKLVFERQSVMPGRDVAAQSREDLPADWDQVERRAGGRANLLEILRGVERYVEGEIAESELGRVIRRHWARSRD